MAIEIKFTGLDAGMALDLIEAHARRAGKPVEFHVAAAAAPTSTAVEDDDADPDALDNDAGADDDHDADPDALEAAAAAPAPSLPPVPTAPALPPLPAATTAPAAAPAPVTADVDASGIVWDERIHAGTKTKTKDGMWKKKRGVDPAVVTSVEAELRGHGPATPPAPAPAAAPAPAPVPVPPVAAAAAPAAPVPPVVTQATEDPRAMGAMIIQRLVAAKGAGKIDQSGLNQLVLHFTGQPTLGTISMAPAENLKAFLDYVNSTFPA